MYPGWLGVQCALTGRVGCGALAGWDPVQWAGWAPVDVVGLKIVANQLQKLLW